MADKCFGNKGGKHDLACYGKAGHLFGSKFPQPAPGTQTTTKTKRPAKKGKS